MTFKRILAVIGALALMLGMAGPTLAQESTSDTRISIWVDGAISGPLAVNVIADAFRDVAPGGTSTGALTIVVTDGRVGTGLKWYVQANIGPFEGDYGSAEFGFQQFDAELDWLNPVMQPDTPSGGAGGIFPVAPGTSGVFHNDDSQGGAQVYLATGPATVSIPLVDGLGQPLAADYYSATITVSIYGEDPDA